MISIQLADEFATLAQVLMLQIDNCGEAKQTLRKITDLLNANAVLLDRLREK